MRALRVLQVAGRRLAGTGQAASTRLQLDVTGVDARVSE